MAKETATSLDLGTDHQFVVEIRDGTETVAIDVSTWALSFMVKRRLSDADVDALITKTNAGGIVIAGVFSSDPVVNLQRVTITVADTDTDAIVPGLARYELKRMDPGLETVLAFGYMELVKIVHRT